MSVDIRGLRSSAQAIEAQAHQLSEQAARLRRIADDADAQSANGAVPAFSDLKLPPKVVMPCPDTVAEYLRVHPDTVDVLRDLAAALVNEFENERSSIELGAEDDDYISETDLVFKVRVATYDDSFMERLHQIEERFDDRLSHTTGSVYLMTDHVPAA